MRENNKIVLNDVELHDFYGEFKRHIKSENNTSKELLVHVEKNKRTLNDLSIAIKDIGESQESLSKETKEMRDAWVAAQGAVKVAGVAGNIFKWLSATALVGWVIIELTKKVN